MNYNRVRALLRTISLNAIFAQTALESNEPKCFEADIDELADTVCRLLEEVYENKVEALFYPRIYRDRVMSDSGELVLPRPDPDIDPHRGPAAGPESRGPDERQYDDAAGPLRTDTDSAV